MEVLKDYVLPKGRTLGLKVVRPGGEPESDLAPIDFRWDLTPGGITTAPDWDSKPECGGGLHVWAWAQGNLYVSDIWSEPDVVWLAVDFQTEDMVPLVGLQKVPECRTVAVGTSPKEITDFIRARTSLPMSFTQSFFEDLNLENSNNVTIVVAGGGRCTAGDYSSVEAGPRGYASVGDYSKAVVGDGGEAYAGNFAEAVAGDNGTAYAGGHSSARAGYKGSATVAAYGHAEVDAHGTAEAGEGGTAIAHDGGKAKAGVGGYANAGFHGTAEVGSYGRAIAGRYGLAIAGANGYAEAGKGGRAKAGTRGTAFVGDKGMAEVGINGIAYVGEGGRAKAGQDSVLYMYAGGTPHTVIVGNGGCEPDCWYCWDMDSNKPVRVDC